MEPTIIKVPEVSSYKVIKDQVYEAKNITAQKCLNMKLNTMPSGYIGIQPIKIQIFSGSFYSIVLAQ